MKDLVIICLGKKEKDYDVSDHVQVVFSDGTHLEKQIESISSKYIAFVKDTDEIAENYITIVSEIINNDFDYCYLNHSIKYHYMNEPKVLENEKELVKYKPYPGSYIWSYIFNREKLVSLIHTKEEDLKKYIDENFNNGIAYSKVLYWHNPDGKKLINNFIYVDVKKNEYHNNIIYIGTGCNGTFNGYISWMKHIGRCFGEIYNIVFLYDEGKESTLKSFQENHIKTIKRKNDVNYVCSRLLTTYSDYFYPNNIISLEESCLFIHGNMADYKNVCHYYDDIYTRYIAVSRTAAKKAIGFFPTKNIEHIINPYKLDMKEVKPHLKLVSAQRYSDVKCPERIELLASILDELQIPYTWNYFTDKYENTNKGGLIFRNRVKNPLPYIKDADYFVLLSRSEAMPYCILEALSVNTKVIVTPLDNYKELDIKDGKDGFIISSEYFIPKNKDKLIQMVKKIYKNKDMEVYHPIDEDLFEGYHQIFK